MTRCGHCVPPGLSKKTTGWPSSVCEREGNWLRMRAASIIGSGSRGLESVILLRFLPRRGGDRRRGRRDTPPPAAARPGGCAARPVPRPSPAALSGSAASICSDSSCWRSRSTAPNTSSSCSRSSSCAVFLFALLLDVLERRAAGGGPRGRASRRTPAQVPSVRRRSAWHPPHLGKRDAEARFQLASRVGESPAWPVPPGRPATAARARRAPR